ncbi:MAG: nth [Gammaproteobacteria bacterium]|jgi:endonuclease-3|nr:nth [Gammaproteobacteria bacterium]
MNKAKINEIFKRFQAANPKPTTELEYSSVFELLISVILSAHTTDKSVNKATRELYQYANTPETIYALGEDKLREAIRNVGLSNSKAKHIIQTCKILMQQYDSKVPATREALESLPGVGRKTANVILNTAFGQEAVAVDTHIFRVANRTNIAPGKNVRQVEEKLLKVIAKPHILDAHHWLVLHGRYICIARKPKCPECIIKDLCEYPNKTP